jgi:hypothetical protein
LAAETAKVKASEERAAKLLLRAQQERIRSEATKAIEGEGGSVTLLLPHVMERCRVVADPESPDDLDLLRVVVVDGQGNPEPSLTQSAEEKRAAELVGEMKAGDEYAAAFTGTQAAGSGAGGGKNLPGRATGRTIRANDQAAIDANIDRIAKGEVTVVSA